MQELVEVLRAFGLQIVDDEVESAHVIPALRVKLERKARTDSDLQERLVSGFESMVDDNLALALKPIHTLSRGKRQSRVPWHHAESITRVLLCVECIQARVMEVLLHRLPEIYSTEEGIHTARAVLTQMQFLDSIADAEQLSSSLLEVLEACPEVLQRELLAVIPQIVADDGGTGVIDKLRDLMNDKSELLVAVLDALSCLPLSDDVVKEVREDVVERLESITTDDLPVVLRFLLQTTDRVSAPAVVRDVRKYLEIGPDDRSKNGKKGSYLVVEALLDALRFQVHIAPAFLKEIAAVKEGHKVLDIWMLLAISKQKKYEAQVVKVVKKKVNQSSLAVDVVDRAFEDHDEAIEKLFPQAVSLAAALLSDATSPSVRLFGCHMYLVLFRLFDDVCMRQDIVASVVGHVGSGRATEMDSALYLLLDLAREGEPPGAALKRFMPLVKSMLDFLHGFTNGQLRLVFRLFSFLFIDRRKLLDDVSQSQSSFAENAHDEEWKEQLLTQRTRAGYDALAAVDSHLMIVVSKQIACSAPESQRIGIIAAVALMCEMRRVCCMEFGEEDERAGVPCKEMFELVKCNVSKISMTSMAFLWHELAIAFRRGELSAALGLLLRGPQQLTKDLYRFLVAYDCVKAREEKQDADDDDMEGDVEVLDTVSVDQGLGKCRVEYNLDKRGAKCCLQLLPVVCHPDTRLTHLDVMCPVLHAFALCLHPAGGLQEISAVLGCPVLVFNPDSTLTLFSALSSEAKEMACNTVFYAMDWFRELVNTYCGGGDVTQGKLCARVEQLVKLSCLLDKMMGAPGKNGNAAFRPLLCRRRGLGEMLLGSEKALLALLPRAKQTRAAPSLKKAAAVPGAGPDDDDEEESDDEPQKKKRKKGGGAGTIRKARKAAAKITKGVEKRPSQTLRPLHRELFLRSFHLLRHPLVVPPDDQDPLAYESELSDQDADAEGADDESKWKAQLSPDALEYLLQDLLTKFVFALSKKSFFSAKLSISNLSLEGVSPEAFLEEWFVCFDHVHTHMLAIVRQLGFDDAGQSQVEVQTQDLPDLLTESAVSSLVRCVDCMIKLTVTLFKCDALHGSARGMQAFKKCVLHLACSPEELDKELEEELPSLTAGLEALFAFLEQLIAPLPELSSCVAVVGLMQRVAVFRHQKCRSAASEDTLRHSQQRVSVLACSLLGKAWPAHTSFRGENVGKLVTILVDNAEDPLRMCHRLERVLRRLIINNDLEPEEEQPGEEPLDFSRILNRKTAHLFFRPVMECLVRHFQKISLKDPDDLRWYIECAKTHAELVQQCRNYSENVAIIGTCLRTSSAYLLSIANNVSSLTRVWDTHREPIVEFVKSVQRSTRLLQTMCQAVKRKKNASLINTVPKVKKALEKFIYEVKQLLQDTDSLGAFVQQDLKARNLDGTELSQEDMSTEDEVVIGDETEDEEEHKHDE